MRTGRARWRPALQITSIEDLRIRSPLLRPLTGPDSLHLMRMRSSRLEKPLLHWGRASRIRYWEYLEQNRASGFEPDAASFFNMVLLHTIEGTFCDPAYGGNLDFIGWEMIGYPGIRLGVTAEQQRMDSFPEMTRVSAYDLQMFDADSTGERTDDG